MAHRTNVVQVPREFDTAEELPERVTDPVCGKDLNRKEARHVLVRGPDAFYFCSKECQQNFGSKARQGMIKTAS